MSGSFYRGTSIQQDGRFANKEKKIIRSREWPKEFENRVDVAKVNLDVFRPWVENKVAEILGVEDEVVASMCISEIENCDEKGPDPRALVINMTGFLEEETEEFVLELWNLLISAQQKDNGIPDELVEFTRAEMNQELEEKQEQLNQLDSIIQQIKKKKVRDSEEPKTKEALFDEDKNDDFREDHVSRSKSHKRNHRSRSKDTKKSKKKHKKRHSKSRSKESSTERKFKKRVKKDKKKKQRKHKEPKQISSRSSLSEKQEEKSPIVSEVEDGMDSSSSSLGN